jgi:hypothetical protein
VSKAQSATLEDFGGDKGELMRFKVEQGLRTLTQDEKLQMFGLVDMELKESVNEIRR